jgi:hypothetical protein
VLPLQGSDVCTDDGQFPFHLLRPGDAEMTDIETDFTEDTRTPIDHVERALTNFRESLDLQTVEQMTRYENLQDAVHAAQRQPRVEVALDELTDDPAPEPEVPNATYRDSEPSASVKLAFPFEVDGTTVERIDFRPPAFADVQAVLDGKMAELEMHARMTGVSVQALRAMRWPDIEMITVIARHIAPAVKES